MGDTIRDDIEETIAEALEDSPAIEPAEPVQHEEPVERLEADRVEGSEEPEKKPSTKSRGPDGKFAKSEGQADKPAPLDTKSAHIPDPSKVPPVAAEPTYKPSASMKDFERAEWDKTPKAVQAFIERREKETAAGFQQQAQVRQYAEAFHRAVAPYEGIIRSRGMDIHTATEHLFQREVALSTAPLAQRAKMFAAAVREYGIPIDMLDQALAGENIQEQPGQFDPNQLKQQITQEILGQFNQAREESNRQYGEQTVQQWVETAKPEFLDRGTIKDDMATLMRSRKGMTLDRAYEIACRMDDDIKSELDGRNAKQVLASKQQSIKKAQVAAGSIKSEGAGPQVSNGEDGESLRDTIRASMSASRV